VIFKLIWLCNIIQPSSLLFVSSTASPLMWPIWWVTHLGLTIFQICRLICKWCCATHSLPRFTTDLHDPMPACYQHGQAVFQSQWMFNICMILSYQSILHVEVCKHIALSKKYSQTRIRVTIYILFNSWQKIMTSWRAELTIHNTT
jgi:hypothetical protein